MCYYIDGMDVPFRSFGEIKDFLLSLNKPYMLYQFIDRHVYYGDCASNVFMHCSVLEVGHSMNAGKFHYEFSVLASCDRCSYTSFVPSFMNRSFVRVS